jgi:hypothetical protein
MVLRPRRWTRREETHLRLVIALSWREVRKGRIAGALSRSCRTEAAAYVSLNDFISGATRLQKARPRCNCFSVLTLNTRHSPYDRFQLRCPRRLCCLGLEVGRNLFAESDIVFRKRSDRRLH